MGRSTSLGLAAGFALIILAIITQGSIGVFISLASILIVLGGVASAAMVNYPMEDLTMAWEAVKVAFTGREMDKNSRIEMFTMFARRARRNGLLVLDQDVQFLEDPYARQGLELAIDGIAEDHLVSILDDEIENLKMRHGVGIRVLDSMGAYSPAFGMIGTLIGLILMLQNLDDAQSVGSGLAIALITTFYGAILANLVFVPLSGKLAEMSEKEVIERQMIKTGILALANGENPRIMEKKMLSYVTPLERLEYKRLHGERSYSAAQEDKMYSHWLNQQKERWEGVVDTIPDGS